MQRVVTASALAQLLSADFNTFQDRALGFRAASKNNDVSGMTQETDGVVWVANADIGGANTLPVDLTRDWRDRFVMGFYAPTGAATEVPGGSNDYLFNQRVIQQTVEGFFCGYTGSGAYSNTAGAGTAVSDGNPPTEGVGGVRSYYIRADQVSDIRLWVNPTTGELNLYNNSGSTYRPCLMMFCSGDLGKR